MVADTSGQNLTFLGNSTVPTNTTILVWGPIPTDAGRSLQADIVACAVITYVIAFSFVLLRFYTRGWLNHVLGPSDWCILPALICAGGVTASLLEQVVHGAGKHSWDVDITTLPRFEKAAWYGILFYNLSLVFTRISILLLYKRIFTYSWVKKAIQVGLVLVTSIGIWLVISVFTACVPLEAFWDWSLYFTTHVYCQPVNIWWANAALHIASDFVIMGLPMPVLSSLKLPRRQKYALIGVFALGFTVCVISVVRLVALIDVAEEQSWDATYTSSSMIFLTAVEVNAAIACACIMTLKPLIQRIFPRILSPSNNFRDPTLQWITPATSTSTTTTNGTNTNSIHRTSRQSFTSSPHHQHARRQSTASDRLKKRGSAGSRSSASASAGLPQVQEYEGDDCPAEKYHEILFLSRLDSPDLEAQQRRRRTCSVSATITTTTSAAAAAAAAGEEDEEKDEEEEDKENLLASGGASPMVVVAPPPKAHVRRLSIHVTRSVCVEKFPRSPTPGEGSEEDGGSTERRGSGCGGG